MKCEFCEGHGFLYQRISETQHSCAPLNPCPECNGTGIADCCNGMTAGQCADNEVKRDG